MIDTVSIMAHNVSALTDSISVVKDSVSVMNDSFSVVKDSISVMNGSISVMAVIKEKTRKAASSLSGSQYREFNCGPLHYTKDPTFQLFRHHEHFGSVCDLLKEFYATR